MTKNSPIFLFISSSLNVALAFLCGFAPIVQAHEGEHHADDDIPLAFSVGLGLKSLQAEKTYPTPRLPGVLEAGQPLEDDRRTGLDYAEIGLKSVFTSGWQSQWNVARHGTDKSFQTESLWVKYQRDLNNIFKDKQGYFSTQLGRQAVPLGLENLKHSHTRDFAIAPLALRAMINEGWFADGIRLDGAFNAFSDNHLDESTFIGGGISLWHNRATPGTDTGNINLKAMRLNWQTEDWLVEGGLAEVDADGRATITTGQGGHTHSTPTCTKASAQQVCFFGKATLYTLASQWRPRIEPLSNWRFNAELWHKKDTGSLQSVWGEPDYTGKLTGGWLSAAWRVNFPLEVLARYDILRSNHVIEGANARLAANQAQIISSDTSLKGLSLATRWLLDSYQLFTLEYRQENTTPTSNRIWLLRYQVNADFRP